MEEYVMGLKEIITNIQSGELSYLNTLLDELESIINNMSKNLPYPEAKTDLIIFLIELSKKINIDNYHSDNILKWTIIKSLKNKKIDLFRKNIKSNIKECSLTLEIPFEMHSNIEIEDILSKLPLNQRIVLKERFINQKSDIEIANELGVTRQAINRSKNRGLKNLKKIFKNL